MCARISKRQARALAPEGSIIALPLRDRGYGVGVVARNSGDGALLVYYYGVRLDSIDSPLDHSVLKPENAIRVGQVGDLGVLNGAWKVIGAISPWSRSAWPLPPFARYVQGVAFYKSYYDEDTLRKIREVRIEKSEADELWEDGMDGYVAAEIVLTKRLRELGI
ncbi:Imm26 family immunity protein [Accumulibacter sp.]|uniref:Imm26 family immunity protein n=1 Tax=Accumulibacter sp. TaxID=2053492 RepID=UPI0025D614AB|nr:Imm26 family immunity protein [Accumulibacter sp.]MCM8625540.1 immunity 26/phosphotriesterase HocA family protein [Accumulibacter sp.]